MRQERPAARAVARARGRSRALTGAALRIDERAQAVEAVGGHETGGDQFPESRLDLGVEVLGAARRCP